MSKLDSYVEIAEDYADGVRVLFTSSGTPAGERGGHGPKSYDEIADQAENLLPDSEKLTQLTVDQLSDSDTETCTQASIKLMAKALIDLEVSAYLLKVAVEEEKQMKWSGGQGTERSRSGLGRIEDHLSILVGKDKPGYDMADRTGLRDIHSARSVLSNSVNDALTLILKRAAKAGQTAAAGIMGLGLGELAEIAGAVCMDIAGVFGQAEKVTRLYNLFRNFVKNVYDSLTALIGQPMLQEASKKFLEWLDKLNNEENISTLIENLYKTKQTRLEISPIISESQAEMDKYVSAINGVNSLNDKYQKQIKLAEKLLNGLKYLGGVASSALPQGKLLSASLYTILGAYIILVGADYVDSPELRLLDRVPGVRHIVENNLQNPA